MSPRSPLFDHIWLKLFSVVLGTLIWLAVWANLRNEPLLPRKFGNEATLTLIDRPVMVLCESAEHMPAALVPQKATVTVRGPPELIQGLKADDIDVFVRLADRGPFSGELPVHVHVPIGAAVTQVTPITVQVNTRPPGAKPASNL